MSETDVFLKMALQHAPTVGKRYVTQGELLNRAQSLHADFQVQRIELCKGANRYRSPPPNVTKEQCPWRMTMIIKRDGSGLVTFVKKHGKNGENSNVKISSVKGIQPD